MADYIVQEPARTEDGQFIVTLTSEEGYTLAQGVAINPLEKIKPS